MAVLEASNESHRQRKVDLLEDSLFLEYDFLHFVFYDLLLLDALKGVYIGARFRLSHQEDFSELALP